MSDRLSPPTRATLLDRLREGTSPLAWDEFFGIYGPILHAYARGRGCSDDTAEDVVQEVMLRIFESRDVFRYDPERGRFRDWLGAVTRNKVAEIRRRPSTRARPAGEPDRLPEIEARDPAPDATWEETFEKLLLAAALDAVCREVEPRDYIAFELSEIDGVPPDRIAALTGRTRNAVYKARRKVLDRLRELVGAYGDEGRLPERLREALALRPPPQAERSLSDRASRAPRGRPT